MRNTAFAPRAGYHLKGFGLSDHQSRRSVGYHYYQPLQIRIQSSWEEVFPVGKPR